MTRLESLFVEYGQSPWIDNIRRDWLEDGTLARLVADGARGVTSNPAIFAKAFATSNAYDALIAGATTDDAERVFERLASADVRDACDVLSPVHARSREEFAQGRRRYADGFVSLEVSPRLARDTQGTVAAARHLADEVARPNVMIKIPATREGLPAITRVLGEGINVNVTLIFSLDRYDEVLGAWSAGLEAARANGRDLGSIASVASFFVSRVDAAMDKLLPAGDDLRGRVANAQVAAAYEVYLRWMASDRVTELLGVGAQVQRPLWASTSPKDPSYDELLYVDSIVADETVNTMPDATLVAAAARGDFAKSLLTSATSRTRTAALLGRLPEELSLDEVTTRLEREGVDAFVNSYEELLGIVAAKLARR
ncbi:MAG: transaldolase [Acidobacteria bacterium]|nr:transaldolase [Acidobacteriota bacterium]